MGAPSRTAINKAFAPLSRALRKEGKPIASAVIAGFHVKAERQNNLHVRYGGSAGPAWSPVYTASGGGFHNASGSRDEMVECIWWRAKHAAKAKATGVA